MADTSMALTGPRGAKPRKAISGRNIMLYGTLIVVCVYYLLPLWVMVMTSLKGMPEVRLGNIFAPPVEITFQPWVKAWSEACTGLNCDGLSRGFWNSVLITVPSVLMRQPPGTSGSASMTEFSASPAGLRIAAGPLVCAVWNIISFSTTAARPHIGASSTRGCACGPSGQ